MTIPNTPLVEIAGLRKTYADTGGQVVALDGVDLSISAGSFVVVEGASGSGKTTLLMILGGMARPSAGQVLVAGRDVYAMDVRARARYRAETIGFVFQAYHLIPYLTVLENVLLADPKGDRDKALSLLEDLGLADRLQHRPAQLSAGERQRTGLARAMLNNPPLILADEPTGNLDTKNSEAVYQILDRYRADGGTVVVVTHGLLAGRFASQHIKMERK